MENPASDTSTLSPALEYGASTSLSRLYKTPNISKSTFAPETLAPYVIEVPTGCAPVPVLDFITN